VPETRVEWTDSARDDVRAIAFYIARDSLANALAVAQRLEQCVVTLCRLAIRGRVVSALQRLGERQFREVLESPWRIIYLVEADRALVVAIVDGRRDLQDWLREQEARFRMAHP